LAKKTEIRLRRSNTANAIPTAGTGNAGDLGDGEMAMNTLDGALYFKKSDNTIITAHDDTIMHIDSTNDAVEISGTLTADKVPLLGSALGWVRAFGTNDESKIVWDSDEDAIEFSPGGASGGLVHTAFRVYAGQKVHITLPQKSSGSGPSSGLTIKVYQHNGDLPTGKTHVGDTSVGAFSSFMQDDDAQYTIVSNVSTSTSWLNRTLEFTPTADGYASIGVSVGSVVGSTKIYLKQPKITNAGQSRLDVIAMQYVFG